MKIKKGNPSEAIQPLSELETIESEMTIEEAIKYFETYCKNEVYTGWTIRYYGFGEHLVYWLGDGTFIDFGVDQDTKITWNKMKKILIESAKSRKKQEEQINKLMEKND